MPFKLILGMAETFSHTRGSVPITKGGCGKTATLFPTHVGVFLVERI